MSVLEQQRLLTRLQRYAPEATATTQQVWKVNEHLQINVTLAKYSAEKWVSVEASSARAKRRAKVWLEYLLWLAYVNLGEGGQQYQRIVVFSDRTILCTGVSSNQAREWLKPWLKAWDGHGGSTGGAWLSQPTVKPPLGFCCILTVTFRLISSKDPKLWGISREESCELKSIHQGCFEEAYQSTSFPYLPICLHW
jgi:hypothetical protein